MNKKQVYMIVGLGNPGKKYENTRHNMGYLVIDELLKNWNISKLKKRYSSLFAVTKISDAKVLIMKPLTFMNDSGRAVAKAASFYRVAPENIVVIYDDIDLPVGALRIRKHGGPGTHNGMRSIVSHIGDKFPRIRVGIGSSKKNLVDYVLSVPSKSDREKLIPTINEAAGAIDLLISDGIEQAMQKFNKS